MSRLRKFLRSMSGLNTSVIQKNQIESNSTLAVRTYYLIVVDFNSEEHDKTDGNYSAEAICGTIHKNANNHGITDYKVEFAGNNIVLEINPNHRKWVDELLEMISGNANLVKPPVEIDEKTARNSLYTRPVMAVSPKQPDPEIDKVRVRAREEATLALKQEDTPIVLDQSQKVKYLVWPDLKLYHLQNSSGVLDLNAMKDKLELLAERIRELSTQFHFRFFSVQIQERALSVTVETRDRLKFINLFNGRQLIGIHYCEVTK